MLAFSQISGHCRSKFSPQQNFSRHPLNHPCHHHTLYIYTQLAARCNFYPHQFKSWSITKGSKLSRRCTLQHVKILFQCPVPIFKWFWQAPECARCNTSIHSMIPQYLNGASITDCWSSISFINNMDVRAISGLLLSFPRSIQQIDNIKLTNLKKDAKVKPVFLGQNVWVKSL